MAQVGFRTTKKFAAALLAVAAAALAPGPIAAAPPSAGKAIEIIVRSSISPSAAVGILMSAQGASQVEIKDFKKIDAEHTVVFVPYEANEIPDGTTATAMIVSEEGAVAFGEVRPVSPLEPRESFLAIPVCPREKVTASTMAGQLSLLESLVEVRAARRGVAQVKVSQLMTEELLARLRVLERGFGLASAHPDEIGPDLNPVELIDRISRIVEVVEAIKARQAGAKSQAGGKPVSKAPSRKK